MTTSTWQDSLHRFALCALLATVNTTLCAKDYFLFYLGGQSNMDGYGKVSELPEEARTPARGTYIFHGNPAPDGVPPDGRGLWAPLQPGHGAGFQSDGQTNRYGPRFGVELTLAAALRHAFPNTGIAFIKYSRGGTSIHAEAAGNFGCWEPDFTATSGKDPHSNQYDHFHATLRNAFAIKDIDQDGEPDRLIPKGIFWMQGESDAAYTAAIAEAYEGNLKRLMDLIRAALHAPDLPVVIGRISDSKANSDTPTWKHGNRVRQAQADFCDRDRFATLVQRTDSYGYSDPWHYDSKGYLDLGEAFAEALLPYLGASQ